MEGVSILGHLFMMSIWPRKHRNLPIELGDRVGPTDQRRQSMQLVRHVGSSAKGTGNKGLTAPQRHASRNLHVHLHLGCNMCPSGASRFEASMDIGGDLYEY